MSAPTWLVVVDTAEHNDLADNVTAALADLGAAVRVARGRLDVGDVLVASVRARRTTDDAAAARPPNVTSWEALGVGADDDVTLVHVIERKSAADLAASVMSGHFHQQKARMRSLRAETGASLALLVEQAPQTMHPPAKGVHGARRRVSRSRRHAQGTRVVSECGSNGAFERLMQSTACVHHAHSMVRIAAATSVFGASSRDHSGANAGARRVYRLRDVVARALGATRSRRRSRARREFDRFA